MVLLGLRVTFKGIKKDQKQSHSFLAKYLYLFLFRMLFSVLKKEKEILDQSMQN